MLTFNITYVIIGQQDIFTQTKEADVMFRKMLLCLSAIILCFGCSREQETEERADADREQEIAEESIKLANGYQDIYDASLREEDEEILGMQQKIIDCVGKSGYAAVDDADQTDMINYAQVETFCEHAAQGQKGEVTIISVTSDGGFLRYDMETQDGEIEVALTTLSWQNSEPKVVYYHEFTAHSWEYTEKGYLFIQEYQPEGYDGAPGEIAFRVKPLDEKCRELNRKYVYPLGYERNNLLVADWDETDYSELELYDLYERFYWIKYGESVPYEAYNGAEYEIPEEEFEEVLQSYLTIDSGQIREKTVYDRERHTYRYRPRGMGESEFSYGPYPEVVGYEEQEDGTLRLFVEAVWERKMTDRGGLSELVVRPFDDGSFQYVSNHVVSWDENLEFKWYFPRLTDEEWTKRWDDIL